jgi:hypothetical protein
MFGLGDLMKNIDLGDVLEKVGLSDKDKEEVKVQAADALKYRTSKEKVRGNEKVMTNLFSTDENTPEANQVAKKLEGDLAHNLKTKSGMSEGIVDQIKSAVMQKVMSSFTGEAAKNGDKGGNGLLEMFTDGDMMDNIKSKLGGFFK